VRPAEQRDWPTLVENNRRMAEETEGVELDPATLESGIRGLLDDDSHGRYWVACDGDRVVGQVMHTREWSDWRNGQLWWLQSVYVLPEYRRQGVFRSLLETLRSEAEADPAVVGLRLYVDEQNESARGSYRNLGFEETGYVVMEQLFKG